MRTALRMKVEVIRFIVDHLRRRSLELSDAELWELIRYRLTEPEIVELREEVERYPKQDRKQVRR